MTLIQLKNLVERHEYFRCDCVFPRFVHIPSDKIVGCPIRRRDAHRDYFGVTLDGAFVRTVEVSPEEDVFSGYYSSDWTTCSGCIVTPITKSQFEVMWKLSLASDEDE